MKKAIAALAISVLLVAADEPPRPGGVQITTEMPLLELQACATRRLLKWGEVTPIPIKGGVELAMAQSASLFARDKPRWHFYLVDQGQQRTLEVSYRHPITRAIALAHLRDLVDKCAPASAGQFPPG